jgi:tRNA (Thr-GGU) A37 N-methylase
MLFTSDALAGLDAFSHAEVINRLGVTVCKVLAIEGTWLNVEGLDAIDGTQVIDIKPVMREFLPRGDVRQPEWVSELMMEYW